MNVLSEKVADAVTKKIEQRLSVVLEKCNSLEKRVEILRSENLKLRPDMDADIVYDCLAWR